MPAPWRPETDPVRIRRIGKLGEESNELGKVCFRALIQGLDGIDPATSKPNKVAMIEEIADVLCNIDLAMEFLNLDAEKIYARRQAKKTEQRAWQRDIRP